MEDEPRTSNFSCQSCRIKKVTSCLYQSPPDRPRFRSSAIRPSRAPTASKTSWNVSPKPARGTAAVAAHAPDQHVCDRARPNPGSVTPVDSEIPFKKFIGLMEKTLKDAALFVQRVPDAGVGTRIVDWLRQHTHRLQSREEFFSRKESSLTGKDSFPATMWHEWFGMEHQLEAGLPVGYKDRFQLQRHHMALVARGLGIPDLDEYCGHFLLYKDVSAELLERPWVPASMLALLDADTFPGAAIVSEYQVSAHSFVVTNSAFSRKYFTASELTSTPWGMKRIFDIPERGEFISSSIKECLSKRPASKIGEPLASHCITNVIDKQGSKVLCYMRRYFWLEVGGRRSNTVLVLYPLPNSHYLTPKTDSPATARAKAKPKAPPIKKAATVALMQAAQAANQSVQRGDEQENRTSEAPPRGLQESHEGTCLPEGSGESLSDLSVDFKIPVIQALCSAVVPGQGNVDDGEDIDQLLGTLLEVDNDTILSLLGTCVC